MSKALIARFSQTGTTSEVGKRIAGSLKSAGFQVDELNIAGDGVPDLKECDVLGIGTPTYFFHAPFIVKDFVRKLPGLRGKASFVFVLHGTRQGSCGNWIRKRLAKKGSRDLGYFDCYGADYFVDYMRRGYLFSADSPTQAELESAEDFGRSIAERFKAKAAATEKNDPPTAMVYALERFLMSRVFVRLMYTKAFRADKKCDSCGICISACPVNNITAKENGRPKWHTNCLMCASCQLKCPRDAIHTPFDWFVLAPFMSYNIKKALKESIPYATVEHSGGKTRRI